MNQLLMHTNLLDVAGPPAFSMAKYFRKQQADREIKLWIYVHSKTPEYQLGTGTQQEYESDY